MQEYNAAQFQAKEKTKYPQQHYEKQSRGVSPGPLSEAEEKAARAAKAKAAAQYNVEMIEEKRTKSP